MSNIDEGMLAWRRSTNHNKLIELQANPTPIKEGDVELSYFGASCFRLRSPAGLTVMIDPWRNHPSGKLKPSHADKMLTTKFRTSGKMLDIKVLDHLIISKEGYYSFSDEGI